MNNILMLAVMAGLVILLNIVLSDYTLEQAQAGVITLQCHMKDGVRTINPNLIDGLMDGVWLFKNGHAKNCAIIKGGDL